MKLKEKLAEDFVKSFALQLPGSFDFTEGVNCYKAGFEKARKMAIEKMADTPYARFRLRELGEEEVQE